MRKFDVAPDRSAPGFESAAIGGFHDSRSASGNNGISGLSQKGSRFLCGLIFRVVGFSPRGAEDGDAVRDMRQILETLNKLAHDPKHAPGVRMKKLISSWRLEQSLVLRAAGLMIFVKVFVVH
jgi:hypothetical protein